MKRFVLNDGHVLGFFVVHGLLLHFAYNPFQTRMEQIFVVIGLVYAIFYKFRNSIKNSIDRKSFAFLILFSIVCLISGVLNRNTTENNTFLATIFFILSIFFSVFTFSIVHTPTIKSSFLNTIFYLALFYLLINDVLLFFVPSLFLSNGNMFFLGNKFTVSALHLLVSGLAFVYNKKMGYLLLLITSLISLYMNAITGLFGALMYFLFTLFGKRGRMIIQKPVVSLGILFLCSLLIVFNENVLYDNPVFKNIISFFEKEQTINGRLFIYSNVFNVINKSPYFGYGFNSSYSVLSSNHIGVNAQNGLLENVVQFGYFGLFFLLSFIYSILHLNSANNRKETYYIFLIVLIQFIESSVEITIGLTFFVYLSFVLFFCQKVNDVGVSYARPNFRNYSFLQF